MLHLPLRFRAWTQGPPPSATTAPRSIGPLRFRAWTQGPATTTETAPRSIGPLRFRAWTHGSASTPETAPRSIGPLRFRAWTQGAEVEPPVTPATDTSGGWEVVFRRRKVPKAVREVLEDVARRQVDRQEEAQKAQGEAQRAPEYPAVTEAALDALAASLREREIKWKDKYAEILRLVIEGMAAQRAAEIMAAAERERLQAIARNNENARRVLLLMMLH